MRVEAFPAPYRHWIISDFADPLIVSGAHGLLPPATWPGWVRYANDCEQKRTSRDAEQLGDAVRRLLYQLSSPEVVGRLAGLSGVVGLQADPEWHGAGVHVSDPGDWLNCHLDYALHGSGLERRVNLIVFLNPEWREEWGGAFELYDDAARDVVKRIYPAFNRAVVWEAGDLAYHGAQATSADAPPRVTACSYFLATARPNTVRRRALFVPRR